MSNRHYTEMPETRIRKDPSGGWLIEIRVGSVWTIKAWTVGTKRDAERSEQEIIEDMKAEAGHE